MTATQKYQVDVFEMQRFTDKGSLKAFADVKIGKSVKIMGMRIIQQPNQAAWVSPPQRTWHDKQGATKYAPIVELSGDLKAAVDEAVLQAWAQGE